MGCSIKEWVKVWRKSVFTDVFRCDMITMLGGFREEAAVLRGGSSMGGGSRVEAPDDR